ncbi:tetratricopeptide repeat protein [Escherichia coli]|uniref:tetratricopeptide repeat protein n=3 Tax=Escherichia coli TaxID=562 RepID=UPI000E02D7FB|nr:Uncharacterised protein [Escherichia coli]
MSNDSEKIISTYSLNFLSPDDVRKEELKASQGDSDAAFKLYKYYLFCEPKSYRKQHEWLIISANNGNAIAQYNLSRELESEGKVDESIQWLKKSAEHGNNYAQYQMSKYLLKIGDIRGSEYYLNLSADNGCVFAIKDIIKNMMDSGRYDDALIWVEKLKKLYPDTNTELYIQKITQKKKAIQIIIIYNYSHRVTVLQEIYLAYKVAASKDKVLCNPSSHIGVKT